MSRAGDGKKQFGNDHSLDGPAGPYAQPGDKLDDCIQVMGWVSNFAQIWKAIEHFEKDEGWRILDSLCRHARHVLVSTPWGFRPQEIPGQPFETHRSGWYPWQFRKRYHVHATRIFPTPAP